MSHINQLNKGNILFSPNPSQYKWVVLQWLQTIKLKMFVPVILKVKVFWTVIKYIYNVWTVKCAVLKDIYVFGFFFNSVNKLNFLCVGTLGMTKPEPQLWTPVGTSVDVCRWEVAV